MPMSPDLKVRYEFDPTAASPDNLVSNETVITDQRLMKVVVPKHFLFYTDTVVIRDVQTGETLTPADYRFDDVSETVAMNTGHSAAATILITKDTHSTVFELSYQVVGGWYSHPDYNDIIRRLEDLNKSDKPISWKDILGKPDTYPPAAHLHPVWQTFGYGHLIYILERVEQAILLGDHVEMNLLWKRLKEIESSRSQAVTDLSNRVNLFITNTTDSLNDMKGKLDTDVKGLTNKVNSINDALTKHLADENPHNITPELIGAFNKNEVNQLVSELNQSITQLRDNVYTKVDVDGKVETINQSIQGLQDSKLGKEETATDSNRFAGHNLESFKNVIGETAHKLNGSKYVSNVNPYPVSLEVGELSNVILKRKLPSDDGRDSELGDLLMVRSIGHLGNHRYRGTHGIYTYDKNVDDFPASEPNGFPPELLEKGITSATVHSLPNGRNTLQVMHPNPTSMSNGLPVFEYYTRFYDSLNKSWTKWVKTENFRNHMSDSYNLDDSDKLATSKAVKNLNDMKQNVIRNALDLTGTDSEVRAVNFSSSEQDTHWGLRHDATDLYLTKVDNASNNPIMKLLVPQPPKTANAENPFTDTLALASAVDKKLDNYGTSEHSGNIKFTADYQGKLSFNTGGGEMLWWMSATDRSNKLYPKFSFVYSEEGHNATRLEFPSFEENQIVAYRDWVRGELDKIVIQLNNILSSTRLGGSILSTFGSITTGGNGTPSLNHGTTSSGGGSGKPPHLLGSG